MASRQKVFSFLVYKYNKFPLKERQSRGTYRLFFYDFEADFTILKLSQPQNATPTLLSEETQPFRRRCMHDLLEGTVERAVAAETTFKGQLLNGHGLVRGGTLLAETDEVADTQVVDISVVSDALQGEVLA